MSPRVAIVQFPGVNCEAETARALRRVGLEPEIWRWTRAASELEPFDAYVVPGGFSYQDRVRAGALAAKHALTETLVARAEQGAPVLGICNGAQVLAEAGLVPGGGGIELALARNRMPGRAGYHARWVHVRVERSHCLFLSLLSPGELLPLPVAHGEGRFTAGDPARLQALVEAGQTPLRYATVAGSLASAFPDNPNGSEHAVAAVSNARGSARPRSGRAEPRGGRAVGRAARRGAGWRPGVGRGGRGRARRSGARDLRRAGPALRPARGRRVRPGRPARRSGSPAGRPGAWAQAWIELGSDDPEAMSALTVARGRLAAARRLLGLRRLRLFELHGPLPGATVIEDLVHRSTWFYNPHKERCRVRATPRSALEAAAGEQAVLVVERGGARRPAAERWWRHETGAAIEVCEATTWLLRFESGEDAAAAARALAVLESLGRGLLCNPNAQDHAIAAAAEIPLPWIATVGEGE